MVHELELLVEACRRKMFVKCACINFFLDRKAGILIYLLYLSFPLRKFIMYKVYNRNWYNLDNYKTINFYKNFYE